MNATVITEYILKIDQISITPILFSKLSWVYIVTNNEIEDQH